MGVKIKGLKQAQKKIAKTQDAIDQGSEAGSNAVAEQLAENIRQDAPVDTGALKRSVRVSGDTVTVGGGEVDYADVVERREPFIQPNVVAIRGKSATIVEREIGRRLP